MKLKQLLKEIAINNPSAILDLKPHLAGYNPSEVETWNNAKSFLTEDNVPLIYLENTFPQNVKIKRFYLTYMQDSGETFLWGGIDNEKSKNIIDKLGFNDLIWLNDDTEFRIRLKPNMDKITYNGEPITSLP